MAKFNVGDTVEFFDPLLGRRIIGEVYYCQKSLEHNGWNTYVRSNVPGVTALHDGMDPVLVEQFVKGKAFRDVMVQALKNVMEVFDVKET